MALSLDALALFRFNVDLLVQGRGILLDILTTSNARNRGACGKLIFTLAVQIVLLLNTSCQ